MNVFHNIFEYISRSSVFFEFVKFYGVSKALRGLFFYNYRILKRIIPSNFIDIVEINGYKMKVIAGDRGISEELSMFKTHEPITTKLIQSELKKDMVCLEAGANIGYYTLLESILVGKMGKILAIEPSPKNYAKLIENIKLNNIENVSTFNFACGDREGKIKFLISKKSNRCTTIDNNKMLIQPSDTIIDVDVMKLDTFLEEKNIEKIDFIRMDVEGYENHIIKGLVKTIQKFHPMFQIEIHKKLMSIEDTKNILLEFSNNGYECKYYIPRDLDMPLIGTIDDVKSFSLNDLMIKLEQNNLPGVFCLFLTQK